MERGNGGSERGGSTPHSESNGEREMGTPRSGSGRGRPHAHDNPLRGSAAAVEEDEAADYQSLRLLFAQSSREFGRGQRERERSSEAQGGRSFAQPSQVEADAALRLLFAQSSTEFAGGQRERERERERSSSEAQERSSAAQGGRSFAQLSQVEADAALARTLQQQFLLETQGQPWGLGAYGNDLMGLLFDDAQAEGDDYQVETDEEGEDGEDDSHNEAQPQSPDSAHPQPHRPRNVAQSDFAEREDYEFLTALGDLVGRESKGLAKETVALLPTFPFDSHSQEREQQGEDASQCLVCCEEYADGEVIMSLLPCNHMFHRECLVAWLDENKTCPKCMKYISG